MSKVTPGGLGAFRGKTGNVVIIKWRKKLYGKAAPRKSTKEPKLEQRVQRAKFKTVISHVSIFSDAIAIGWQKKTGSLTPMNRAMQYAFKNAVIGEYPNFELDHSKILLSKPQVKFAIEEVYTLAAVAITGGLITVSWSNLPFATSTDTARTDRLYAVFFNTTTGYAFSEGFRSVDRASLSCTYRFEKRYAGNQIHGYVFFVSEDGLRTSISQFLPPVTLLA